MERLERAEGALDGIVRYSASLMFEAAERKGAVVKDAFDRERMLRCLRILLG